MKYEKNLSIKEPITLRFMEYLRRAKEMRAILDKTKRKKGFDSRVCDF